MDEPDSLGSILILEDDPGIAHLERMRLVRAGYSAEVAPTPDDARRIIGLGHVDLMVLDYRLDGKANGLDLYKELCEAGLGVPSILVTGFGDERTLLQALRAGVRDFLPKTPDYLDYLVPTVERVMTQVRTERQLKIERERRMVEQAAREQLEAQRAALAESETRFRVLTQAIPQLVWSCRADGYSDFSNEQWCDYTGQTLEQTYGSGWMNVVHSDDLSEMRSLWQRALRERNSFQTNCRIRRAADGRYRWHLSRAWPQRDDRGKVIRWFGTCTDIDDQKQAEKALKDADKKKDEFLAMLAHELRNPLASITHAVALLYQPLGQDDHEWALGVVDRQSKNLTRLIDDLLDISRIGTGKIQIRRERLDATPVLRHAVESVRPFAEAKSHTLRLELDPTPFWLDADPTRLEQIFVNLLTNAAKYTDEGGVITLSTVSEGNVFAATVKDTGLGIPAEMLPRIFDMFTQVEGSIEHANGGLGIGLSLVKTLVSMHGGSIVATSEGPGKGSEFTVRIPTIEPVSAGRGKDQANPVASQRVSRRVLVVDDSVDSSRTLSQLLKLAGHQTAVAETGLSALEKADEFQPEVVLLDIRLPDMDGFQLAERFRQTPGFQKAILVAISGMSQPRDIERSRAAGFDRHLSKPVEFQELLAIIGRGRESTLASPAHGTPNA